MFLKMGAGVETWDSDWLWDGQSENHDALCCGFCLLQNAHTQLVV
jgi:hypothetical protein